MFNMDLRDEHAHAVMNHTALEMDSGEKRLNELGYKQELRREMVCLIYINCSTSLMQTFFFLYHFPLVFSVFDNIAIFFFDLIVMADFVQDTCNNIFKHGSFHWNTTVWPQLEVCRACKHDMGMGGHHILHLVCWNCNG